VSEVVVLGSGMAGFGAAHRLRAEGMRARGAPQASAAGSYLLPSPRGLPAVSLPPQTTISVPVHTALWPARSAGVAVEIGSADHALVDGSN